MVLSPQAQRNWKIASYICTTIAGVYGICFADYHIPTVRDSDNDDFHTNRTTSHLSALSSSSSSSSSSQQQQHILTPIQSWVQEQFRRLSYPDTRIGNNKNNINNSGNTAIEISKAMNDTKNLKESQATTTNNIINNNHDENILELQRIAKGHR